jgi:hypothetical protein
MIAPVVTLHACAPSPETVQVQTPAGALLFEYVTAVVDPLLTGTFDRAVVPVGLVRVSVTPVPPPPTLVGAQESW